MKLFVAILLFLCVALNATVLLERGPDELDSYGDGDGDGDSLDVDGGDVDLQDDLEDDLQDEDDGSLDADGGDVDLQDEDKDEDEDEDEDEDDDLWDEDDDLFENSSDQELLDLCMNDTDLLAPWKQPEARHVYPPNDEEGFVVPMRKVWKHGCQQKNHLNMTEYRQAVRQMRWFCKDRMFTMKTSVYAAVYGETTAYACSRYGVAHPCNQYEWDFAEKAIDHYCGKGVQGWIKFRGWPRLYGRATLNQTICPTVTISLWTRTDYRISPRPVWVDNTTMFEVWRDGGYGS